MKFFTFIILFTLSTCSNKYTVTDEELSSVLSNNIVRYHESQDEKYLNEAYAKLQQNKNYNRQQLTKTNAQLIIALLMNLKKYDELEKVLDKTKNLNDYNRLNTLNIVKYLKLKDVNKQKADLFIQENITRITDLLDKKPKDSLIFADYFSMKMFLKGKSGAIKEIDSMQSVNKEYSDMFYEILKESINAYPDENL